jgi:hypothetical protein
MNLFTTWGILSTPYRKGVPMTVYLSMYFSVVGFAAWGIAGLVHQRSCSKRRSTSSEQQRRTQFGGPLYHDPWFLFPDHRIALVPAGQQGVLDHKPDARSES